MMVGVRAVFLRAFSFLNPVFPIRALCCSVLFCFAASCFSSERYFEHQSIAAEACKSSINTDQNNKGYWYSCKKWGQFQGLDGLMYVVHGYSSFLRTEYNPSNLAQTGSRQYWDLSNCETNLRAAVSSGYYSISDCIDYRFIGPYSKACPQSLMNPETRECLYCPEPSVLENDKCVIRCPLGTDGSNCELKNGPMTCDVKTQNPIGLYRGAKLRSEAILSHEKLELHFYYNNFSNLIFNSYGWKPLLKMGTKIVSTFSPIPYDKNVGVISFSKFTRPSLIMESRPLNLPYWRHNFEDFILKDSSGVNTWFTSTGYVYPFDSGEHSSQTPSISLLEEEGGYVLKMSGASKRIFDQEGRLRRVVFDNGQYHQVHYSGITISHIEHWAGAELLGRLDFEYSQQNNQPYLTRVTDDKGRVARFKWEHEATLHHANQFLLTQITYPDQDNSFDTEQQNNAARTFEYNDPDLPVSITQIYDVDSVDQLPSGKRLYAEFQYDTQGRAIYSSLANGVDAVQVDYLDDNTRAVTNALGKVATYRFNTTNGVKRLASITGEPTSTCAESNVSYEYDAQGYRILKTQNGIKTRYRYDTTGLEIERVEAEGTPEQRIIKTEWNTQLRKPSKVIYPGWVESFMYDTNGQLIKKARSEQ